MAGSGQRDAAIALRDTIGKVAGDVSDSAGAFHDVTAATAVDGAHALTGVDEQFGRQMLPGMENLPQDAAADAVGGTEADAGTAAQDVSATLSPQELDQALNPAAGHQIALGGDFQTGDVTTAPGEAVFWSGATELAPGEEASWPGAIVTTTADGKRLLLAGEDNAKLVAKAQGKVSLELLRDERGIDIPDWSKDPAVQQGWKDISGRYAEGVSGDVSVVLGDSLREGNVWETVERPRLEANPNVTSITRIDLKTLEKTVLWRRE